MPAWLASLLFSLGGKLSGLIGEAFSAAFAMLKGGIKDAMFFHEQGIATARQMGMSIREANAYTESLTRRTQDLARAYGITKEQIAELQKTVSENTVRNLIINDQDADRIAQINKLVGARTAGAFTEAIVNKMGGQLSSMEDAVTQTYARAAKSGLNAAKYSEKVAQNLSLANRFSFRNGVDGIAKMTALSEKLGYNLQSVMGAADKFMEFDEAITTSARLNMLGGAAGAFGSNPLTMMYEAQYDPEKFNERLTDTLKGLATFNEKTGMAEMGGMAMNFAKEIAKALGMDPNEAVSIAKNQATIARKNAIGGGLIDRIAGGDEMLRDFLLNRSQIENGQLVITDASGKKRNINEFTSGSGRQWLEKEAQYSGMSDKDIMRQNAEQLTTINEQISGYYSSMIATISKEIQPVFQKINEFLSSNEFKKGFDTVTEYVKIGAQALGKVAKWAIDNPTLTIIGLAVGSIVSGMFRTWLSAKLFGGFGGGSFRIPGVGRLGRLFTRGFGGSRVMTAGNIAKGTGIGAALAIGGEAVLGANNYAKRAGLVDEDSYTDRFLQRTGNTLVYAGIGAAVGSIIPGIGTAIGAGIGSAVGLGKEYIRQYVEYHDKTGGSIWDFMERDIKQFGAEFNKGIHNIAKYINDPSYRHLIDVKVNRALSMFEEDAENFFKKAFSSETWSKIGSDFANWAKGAYGKFVDFTKEYQDVMEAGFRIGIFKGFGGDLPKKMAAIMADPLKSFQRMANKADGFFNDIGKWFSDKGQKVKNWWNDLLGIDTGAKPKPQQKAATGGIVGGNSRAGDKILMGLNSGELIMNDDQIQRLYGKVQAAKTVLTSIVAKPIGEKEYIYTTPNGGSVGGSNNVKVNDFTINITGEIRLNGGNGTTSIDTRSLLNDASFVSSLKEMIKTSISMDMNGGRKLNDNASMRGLPANTSIWGR